MPKASIQYVDGAPRGAVPLSTLGEGARGRVHTAQLPCEDCDLLNAMGLTDQCEVRVCRKGEPCIVQVNATRLGLASALARRIYITPTIAGAAGATAPGE
jgi:Fe2+ transport system protein FeoA